MDRSQKKCVIASTGAHLLLALLLVIGPAFGTSKSKQDDLPVLDFVPFKTVDALISGGGYRDGTPPTAAPVVQQPPPAPQPPAPIVEKKPDPDPPKESTKANSLPKEEADSLVPSAQPKHKPEISTKVVTRKRDSNDTKAKAEAQAKETSKAWTDSRRQLADRIGRAADRIGEEIAGTTSIKLYGPGGGGVPYANFLQAVKTVYENSWVVPDGISDDYATVVASVTIAKDGSVVRSKILNRSGNALVDHSVQATLDRVKFACPLPEDAKENERTVTIDFNVKVKQGLG